MTLCVHSPPSSHETATVDPAEKRKDFFKYHFPGYFYVDGPLRASLCTSSLSALIGAQLIWGKKPHNGLLNSIVAALESPAPTGVDCICHKARLISLLVSIHFFVYLTYLMHASTSSLL